MKKFLCILALITALSATASYSDEEPPHFMMFNALKLSGGNDAVHVREFDYTDRKYDPTEEDDRTSYEFAYNITVLEQKWSDKQAPKDTRPAKRNGLLNAGEPVEITAFGDKLVLTSWHSDGIRVLDSRGRELFSDNITRRDHKEFELKASQLPTDYYVELSQTETVYSRTPSIGIGPFSVPLGRGANASKSDYCYVLLRVTAGRERRFYEGSEEYNNQIRELIRNQIMNYTLMKHRGLTRIEDVHTNLTESQIISTMKDITDKDPEEEILMALVNETIREQNITDMEKAFYLDYTPIADEYDRRINAGTSQKAQPKRAPARRTRTTRQTRFID